MDHTEVSFCIAVTSVDTSGAEYVCGIRMPCMRHLGYAPATGSEIAEADAHAAWEAEHPNGDPIFTR